MSWGQEILERCGQLAVISESPEHLTRTFLTRAHAEANELVAGWMRAAGLAVRIDPVGNVVGRYEGREPGAPSLLLGSHLDTVRNAGKYDGMLGVVSAIACVARLRDEGIRIAYPVEVIGFANEEGTRFGAAMTGSRAVAGIFDPADLDARDAKGVTMREAMREMDMPPERISEAARAAGDIGAYVELHIEQGPVLEQRGTALGVVTAISGATRQRVELAGLAGHAGTVPMGLRKDALAGAAEIIGIVERRCGGTPGLVGTVGFIEAQPGAVNVISGRAVFTLDIRAEVDADRTAAVADIDDAIFAVAERRGLSAEITPLYQANSTVCSPTLIHSLRAAAAKAGCGTLLLPSGAGHDAVAMHAVTGIGMLFVRCAGGISHNPAEAVSASDAELAARALYRFIFDFEPVR